METGSFVGTSIFSLSCLFPFPGLFRKISSNSTTSAMLMQQKGRFFPVPVPEEEDADNEKEKEGASTSSEAVSE